LFSSLRVKDHHHINRAHMTTTKMETEEEEANNNKSFSRVNELHSMFEDSLTTCFEAKTIGVRLF